MSRPLRHRFDHRRWDVPAHLQPSRATSSPTDALARVRQSLDRGHIRYSHEASESGRLAD